MFKKAQVVMLPTNNKTNLRPEEKGEGIIRLVWDIIPSTYIAARYQHLYLISDGDIKVDETYVINYAMYLKGETDAPIKAVANHTKSNGWRAVIASTDPSLGLPGIPEEWIRDVYVSNNGKIKDVELEIIEKGYRKAGRDNPDVGDAWESFHILKLTPDNKVAIIANHLGTDIQSAIDFIADSNKELHKLENIDQELYDAAEKFYPTQNPIRDVAKQVMLKKAFISGAEWQKNILSLAEKNESKHNNGWIMVTDALPDVNRPIFFVLENQFISLGYFSDLNGMFNTHINHKLFLAYKPEQVIKWQYIIYPKI